MKYKLSAKFLIPMAGRTVSVFWINVFSLLQPAFSSQVTSISSYLLQHVEKDSVNIDRRCYTQLVIWVSPNTVDGLMKRAPNDLSWNSHVDDERNFPTLEILLSVTNN